MVLDLGATEAYRRSKLTPDEAVGELRRLRDQARDVGLVLRKRGGSVTVVNPISSSVLGEFSMGGLPELGILLIFEGSQATDIRIVT